jgi:hypothetical protein
MNTLKQIYLTIVQLVKQVWHLPKTWADHIKNRRLYAIRIKDENERIDRIRNPHKYRGK